ncbi:hypothetical protein SDJN02_16102, partial [Cucurbita argyrosperma subsp. argyrosperma]
MGACATKPKAKVDTAVIPAPEPVDDMVKNTEEVKVVEDEKRVDDVIDEKKKDDTEKVVVEEAKPPSLDSAKPPSLDSAKPTSLDSAKPTSLDSDKPRSLDSDKPRSLDSDKPRSLDSLLVEKEAEVPSLTKAEEQPPKEAAAVAGAKEVKSEAKAAKKDEKSA